METIQSRTAFVTGAASGIGLGIAEALLDAGARVVLADWNIEAAEREADRLGPGALAQHLDVRDRSAWDEARERIELAFGPVDILVNNAGVGPDFNELVDEPSDHFDRLIAIMLTGMYNGIRTFGAGMRDRREGHIVNTSSLCGLYAAARMGSYAAAKFGVIGMSELLEIEMGPHGVGVSVVCPGAVSTNLEVGEKPAGGVRVTPVPETSIDPRAVGEQVVHAIRHNELYIITHPEFRPSVAKRAHRLLEAFDRAAERKNEVPAAGR